MTRTASATGFSSCWRRSARLTSACPRPGPSTARPDIDSPTWSTDSLSTARRRHAWIARGALSRAPTPATADAQVYRGKRVIMEGALASELAMLAWRALRLARADRRTRDFTFNTLRVALREVVAHFPVYRTYVDERSASPQDRRYVEWAVARALSRSRSSDARVFDFLRDALLGQAPERRPASAQPIASSPCDSQQFTSPVAAKGVEDTAFYTFNRLVVAQRGRRRPGAVRHQRARLPPIQRTMPRRRGRTRSSQARPTTTSAPRMCGPGST